MGNYNEQFERVELLLTRIENQNRDHKEYEVGSHQTFSQEGDNYRGRVIRRNKED